jgi:hypothetical protein
MRILYSRAVLTVSLSGDTKIQHTPTQNPPPFPFPVSSYSAVLPITNKPYDTLYTTEYTVVRLRPVIHTYDKVYCPRIKIFHWSKGSEEIKEDKRHTTPHYTTPLDRWNTILRTHTDTSFCLVDLDSTVGLLIE